MTARIFMLINLGVFFYYYYCVTASHKFPCNSVLVRSINYFRFFQPSTDMQMVKLAPSFMPRNSAGSAWTSEGAVLIFRKNCHSKSAAQFTERVVRWYPRYRGRVSVRKWVHLRRDEQQFPNKQLFPRASGCRTHRSHRLRLFLSCLPKPRQEAPSPHLQSQLSTICFLFQCDISHSFSKPFTSVSTILIDS